MTIKPNENFPFWYFDGIVEFKLSFRVKNFHCWKFLNKSAPSEINNIQVLHTPPLNIAIYYY